MTPSTTIAVCLVVQAVRLALFWCAVAAGLAACVVIAGHL